MTAYNPFSLQGKTIFVTGASSGIGRSIAIECSKLGARVVLTGRNQDCLSETMSMLVGEGHESKAFDLNSSVEVAAYISEVSLLDGIVYCAGIQKTSPAKLIQSKDLKEVFDSNIFSTIELNTLLLANKKINKGASIVFISSTAAGLVAENGNAMYSASKGAMTAFSKVLALELSPRKIRVNCVLPGMVKSNLLNSISVDAEQLQEDEKRYPFGYGEPIDVAYATIYLLSDAAKWVTGTNLLLDGGLTLK